MTRWDHMIVEVKDSLDAVASALGDAGEEGYELVNGSTVMYTTSAAVGQRWHTTYTLFFKRPAR